MLVMSTSLTPVRITAVLLLLLLNPHTVRGSDIFGPQDIASLDVRGNSTVNFHGDIRFVGHLIGIDQDSTINNLGSFLSVGNISSVPGRTFSNNIVNGPMGVNIFNNFGSYTQQSGTEETTIYPRFNNSGSVNVSSGGLLLRGGGNHSGSFLVGTSATLNLYEGAHALNGGSLTVNGQLINQFGTTTISAATSLAMPGTVNIAGGAFNIGTPNAASIGQLVMSGGVLAKTGDLALGSLSMTGGSIVGPGHTNVNGSATIGGHLFFNPGVAVRDGRVLNLNQNSVLSAQFLEVSDGAVINIASGTTLTSRTFVPTVGNTHDNFVSGVAGSKGIGVINNFGSFVQDAATGSLGTGRTLVSIPMNNSGTLDARVGKIELAGGGNHTGTFVSRSGGTIELSAGVHTVNSPLLSNAGSYVQRTGTTSVFAMAENSGRIHVDNSVMRVGTLANFQPSTGLLQGGNYIVSRAGSLGIDMGSGNGIRINGASITMDGSAAQIVNTSSNSSAFAILNRNLAPGQITLLNGGAISTESASFLNEGGISIGVGSSLNVAGASSTYTQLTGTTDVGGDLRASAVALLGGILSGIGTVHADILNGAIVRPGDLAFGFFPAGTLFVDGDYSQTETGTLRIGILNFGSELFASQLVVAGSAALDGDLEVGFSGYVPSIGDRFTVASFLAGMGTFDDVIVSGLAPEFRVQAIYESNRVLLEIAPIPEPGTYALLFAGLACLVIMRKRRPSSQ